MFAVGLSCQTHAAVKWILELDVDFDLSQGVVFPVLHSCVANGGKAKQFAVSHQPFNTKGKIGAF